MFFNELPCFLMSFCLKLFFKYSLLLSHKIHILYFCLTYILTIFLLHSMLLLFECIFDKEQNKHSNYLKLNIMNLSMPSIKVSSHTRESRIYDKETIK